MSSKRPPLGLMDQGWAASDVSDAALYREVLSTIRLADELGFDTAWIGEHHHRREGAVFWGRLAATEMVLAHAAAQTTRIHLGTGVRVLATTSAMRTAEEMNTLALLSGGRVDFGIGLGSNQPGALQGAAKAAQFRGLLDDLVNALTDDPATGLPPIVPTSPVDIVSRLFVACRDEATIEHVAARGLNFVMGQAELPSVQAGYVRRFRAAGGHGQARGVRLVFIAPTHEEALARSRRAADIYWGQMSKGPYFREALAKGIVSETPSSEEERLRWINVVAGSPDEVTAALNDYLAETGVDRLDVMMRIAGMDLEDVHRGMRLMREEVAPRLVYRPLPGAHAERPAA